MAMIALPDVLGSQPTDIDEALRLLVSDPNAVVLAGSRAERAELIARLSHQPAAADRCLMLEPVSEPATSTPRTAPQHVAVDVRTQELFALVERVAATNVSVLISGSSGTGKEVVARALHESSARSGGPFVAVNCAAIPDSMLEAMLFGYEKGAFTGASGSRAGKFEHADGGTLLLDEITEMPLSLQAKLLRVLQEREVERLGARQPRSVDVRVVATSNRDLKRAVNNGDFREDLYFRLCVFPLTLPDLRDRPADIPALAKAFVERYSERDTAPSLSASALEAMSAYSWPGNVRELENAIQRALVLMSGSEIQPEDLLLTGIDRHATERTVPGLEQHRDLSERKVIVDALRRNGGRRRETARALGISERTLRHKLKQFRERGHDLLADAATEKHAAALGDHCDE